MWLSRLGVVAVVLLVVLGGVAEYFAHNAEPMLRRRVVEDLQQRFHSRVELDELHLSLLHGLEANGRGLRIFQIAGPTVPDKNPGTSRPMLSVRSFAFHTGVRELLEPTMRLVTVYVDGLELNIPPHREGAPAPEPDKRGQPVLGIVVDRIVGTDVRLRVETSKPGKPALVFDCSRVTLRNVGAKEALEYDAEVVIPRPVASVHSIGHIGPWQKDSPRDTPVDGTFQLTQGQLRTIRGIGGTLAGSGRFSGTLGGIAVSGSTDVPDFSLASSGNAVPLHADYDAVVDGTTGDTTLNRVHATLLESVFEAKGSIVRSRSGPDANPPGYPGHDVELAVESDQARVEDLLRLAVKGDPPLLRGAMKMRARLSIPPGPVAVAHKMRVEGTFSIAGATFTNKRWQTMVDTASERSRGRPEEANARDAKVVSSAMNGQFSIADAVIYIPAVVYRMPGAQVDLKGDYGLDGTTLEFAGTVRTEATASQMLTGWKSILAMPFDRMLKKNGAGVELPIKISGTRSDPKFGVDLDKMGLGFLTGHTAPATGEKH